MIVKLALEPRSVDFLKPLGNTPFVKLCSGFGCWRRTLSLTAEIGNAVTTQKREGKINLR